MKDISLLEPCDILVYMGGGPIGACDHNVVHVAVVSEVSGGRLKVIQGHMWAKDINGKYRSGIMESYVDPGEYWCIVHRRYLEDIPLKNRVDFINWLRHKVCGRYFYDVFSFPRLWIWSNILQPLGLGNLDTNIQIAKGKVCSTWPSEFFPQRLRDAKGCSVDPLPALEDDAGTPYDYLISKALITIQDSQWRPGSAKEFPSDYTQMQPA